MKKLLGLALLSMTLTGCVASVIGLKDPQTGDIGQCRRGWWGTVSSMEQCAKAYEMKGYVRMSEEQAALLPEPADEDQKPVAKPGAMPMPNGNTGYAPVSPMGANSSPMAPMPAMPPQTAPVTKPASMPEAKAASEEEPYFSQYPTSTSHRGGLVLPDFMK